MSTADKTSPAGKYAEQSRLVEDLRAQVYASADPTSHPEFAALIKAEGELQQLVKTPPPAAPSSEPAAPTESAPRGRLLGPLTTSLEVETKLHMQPLPTGIYHLLDPVKDPLFTVTVKNKSRDPRRIRVMAFLEGLSARAVRTQEIEPRKEATFNL